MSNIVVKFITSFEPDTPLTDQAMRSNHALIGNLWPRFMRLFEVSVLLLNFLIFSKSVAEFWASAARKQRWSHHKSQFEILVNEFMVHWKAYSAKLWMSCKTIHSFKSFPACCGWLYHLTQENKASVVYIFERLDAAEKSDWSTYCMPYLVVLEI